MLAELGELASVERAGRRAAGPPEAENLRHARPEAGEVFAEQDDAPRDFGGKRAEAVGADGWKGDRVTVHEREGAAEFGEEVPDLRAQLLDQLLDVPLRLAEGALVEGFLAAALLDPHPGAVAAQVDAVPLALDREQPELAVDDEEVDRALPRLDAAEIGVVVKDVELLGKPGAQRLEEIFFGEPPGAPQRGRGRHHERHGVVGPSARTTSGRALRVRPP